MINSLFVTYEDISDCWSIFKDNIEGFFPLRNVSRPKLLGINENNTMIRNIPIINLKFIPLKAEYLAIKSVMNLNERPYLHIFIGYCEDIDVYRQKFRPKLKSWLESISIRKNFQYLVILIDNQSMGNDSNKNGKTFLLDKIRFDFSDKVSLKLISLKLHSGEILNSIPECIDIISDCIYLSAIMNLNQLDADINLLAGQQNTPRWNYFEFFLAKESKALILTDLGLLSEAIACYDELEALYLELDTSTFSIQFISSLPLERIIEGSDLDISNCAKYRELISVNQISRYDFQAYILSRQINLLLELKNYVQILKRCKEYVCKNVALNELDDIKKEIWIFGTILYVLKIVDINSVQFHDDYNLSNLLADVLLIACLQIKPDYTLNSENSSIEHLLDLGQILDCTATSQMEKNIRFKVSAMRYCLSILRGPHCIHKYVIILSNLSNIYIELKLFNIALELLNEALEKALGLNWPTIQYLLIRKLSDCYWNLKMYREYLQAIFEMIQIPESYQFFDESAKEKVKKAVDSLEDVLSFSFEKFFNIDNVLIKQTADDLIELHLKLKTSYSMLFERCDLIITLYGEIQDIVFSASDFQISENIFIVADLCIKDEWPSGNHRIKSIKIKCGKLQFFSDVVSNIWNQDIHLMATNYCLIKALVPINFDFSEPCINFRISNNSECDIENLSLSISSLILDLKPRFCENLEILELNGNAGCIIRVKALLAKSDFKIQCKISNYVHGRHCIKVNSTFNCKGSLKLNAVSKIEIDLPENWNISRNCIKTSLINMECLKILPAIDREIYSRKITFIGSNCPDIFGDFNFEIDSSVGGIHVASSSQFQLDKFSLNYYLDSDKIHRSVLFPIEALETISSVSCKIIPNYSAFDGAVIGKIVNFEVRLEGSPLIENIPFSIYFDNDHWLLSGSSNGLSKAVWYFDMIPIQKGLIRLPFIKFSTSIPIHLFSYGSTVFVKSL